MTLKKTTLSLSCITLLLPLGIFSLRPKSSACVFNQPDKQVKISFSLKKNERYIFNYTTRFFEAKTLMFVNPGNNDTVITKTIAANEPLVITSIGTIQEKDGKLREIKYELFASPGNDLHLSVTNRFLLDLSKCKKENILADTSLPFYYNTSFLPIKTAQASKNDDWAHFYSTYTEQYSQEIKRIKQITANEPDSIFTHQQILNCKLHYYTRLFNWLYEKNGAFNKQVVEKLTASIPDIERTLQDKDIFQSSEVLNVIDGVVRLKLINAGADFNNDKSIFKEASSADLGKYKASYLVVCIAHAINKRSLEINEMVAEFRKQVKNEEFNLYVSNLLLNSLTGRQLVQNDTIITADGQVAPWAHICKQSSKFIMVDFWASWCVPCRQQMPLMDSIKKALANYPVEFVSVNLDDSINSWKIASKAEMLHLKTNNYHLVNGRKSSIAHQLQINSIPRYVLIKNNKIIAADFYQPTDASFVNELLKIVRAKNLN